MKLDKKYKVTDTLEQKHIEVVRMTDKHQLGHSLPN